MVLALLTAGLQWSLPTAGEAAAGDLDPSFAQDGIVITDFSDVLGRGSPPSPGSDDEAAAVALMRDGRVVAAGSGLNGGGNHDFAIARYQPNGSPDVNFDGDGRVVTDFAASDDLARAVTLDTADRLLAAGTAGGAFALARYQLDGTLDQSFGQGGTVRTDLGVGPEAAQALAVDPDGRIVAAGFSSVIDGPTVRRRVTLVRYLDGGQLDTGFGLTGVATSDFGGDDEAANAVALQPDGTIVVAGASQAGSTTQFLVARYRDTGALDSGYGTGGKTLIPLGSGLDAPGADGARGLALQPDGSAVIAGAAPGPDGRSGFAVVRLDRDGLPDTGFGTEGTSRTALGDVAGARGVAIGPEGRIEAAGFSGDRMAVVRYDASGRADGSFGTAGAVTISIGKAAAANGVAIQPDGRSVVAGMGDAGAGGGADFAVARYLPDPALTVGDIRIGEGDRGRTEARFTVSLSAPAGGLGVSVDYATADGTATAPADYEAIRGTLHIPPGATGGTVTVAVAGDVKDETSSSFSLQLSRADHATLAQPAATGVIVDDEPTVADTVAGGPGLIHQLVIDAPDQGTRLSALCLEPRRAPCLDLAALAPGPGPNPLVIDGVAFEVIGPTGTLEPQTEIGDSGGLRGLATGRLLHITLPADAPAAEVAIAYEAKPPTVGAFTADGSGLFSQRAKGPAGAPDRVRLPGAAFVEPQQPFAVAAGERFVWVADPVNRRVLMVDAEEGGGCPCATLFAGNGAGGAHQEGADPLAAPLQGPYALAPGNGPDGADLFIADTFGHRILRAVTDTSTTPPTARLTTVAGTGALGFSGDGGAATAAQLNSPYGVAHDPERGITYVADTLNHRVRAIDPDGTIATVAGDGLPGYAGDGGSGTFAELNQPRGLTLDAGGALFIVDTFNHAIRRLDPVSGMITTVAGSGTAGFSGDGGPATRARLNSPAGVAAGDQGELYVSDTLNHRLRLVDAAGTITTVAGTGETGLGADSDDATQVRLASPFGVAAGPRGVVFIADTANHRVRALAPPDDEGRRAIAAFSGNGNPSYAGSGFPAARAGLAGVSSVASWDPATGTKGAPLTFVADPFTHTVRRLHGDGRAVTVLGNGAPGSGGGTVTRPDRLGDGPAYPFAVALDRRSPPRFLYVADTFNNLVRRVDLDNGKVTTVAGTGLAGSSGDGGPATGARLSFPMGLAVAGNGDLYIADTYNARIRRVDNGGRITTVAGTGRLGFSGDDGTAVKAELNLPHGVALTGADPPDIYVADTFNHRIRRIDGERGVITTVAGTGVAAFAGDGKAATGGALHRPWGVAVDEADPPNLYIADTGNGRLRLVDAARGRLSSLTSTRVAGSGNARPDLWSRDPGG